MSEERVTVKGLPGYVTQLAIEGERVREYRFLFEATDTPEGVIMLAYTNRGQANGLIEAGICEEYTE